MIKIISTKKYNQIIEFLDKEKLYLSGLTEADLFFIDIGKKHCQDVLNNYKIKDKFTAQIMGHGLTLAAKFLKIKDNQWERARKHDVRQLFQRLKNVK